MFKKHPLHQLTLVCPTLRTMREADTHTKTARFTTQVANHECMGTKASRNPPKRNGNGKDTRKFRYKPLNVIKCYTKQVFVKKVNIVVFISL